MTEIMKRIEPLERYSGVLLAILLLFVIAGLVYVLLGGVVWLFSRAMAKRLSERAQSQLRFGNALGLLATGLLILYGLYIGIRLPWIASGFAHNASDAVN